MAKVTYVKKAQRSKHPRNCEECRTEIKVGDPYKWFATRIGRSSTRKNFCSSCQIRPSHRTTSPHLQALYQAIENAEDILGGDPMTRDDVVGLLEETAQNVREVAEGYTESADNIEEGFGHETFQSEEIREKAQEIESFADELDSAAGEVDNLDDPDEDIGSFDMADYPHDVDDDDKPLDEIEFADWIGEQRDARRQEIFQMASDALGSCPI